MSKTLWEAVSSLLGEVGKGAGMEGICHFVIWKMRFGNAQNSGKWGPTYRWQVCLWETRLQNASFYHFPPEWAVGVKWDCGDSVLWQGSGNPSGFELWGLLAHVVGDAGSQACPSQWETREHSLAMSTVVSGHIYCWRLGLHLLWPSTPLSLQGCAPQVAGKQNTFCSGNSKWVQIKVN